NIYNNHTTHNSYLQILVELGIIGLVLWLLFLVFLIRYSLAHPKSQIFLAWISLVTVFLAIGNDIFTYKYWWIGLFIFVLIGNESGEKTRHLSNDCKAIPIRFK